MKITELQNWESILLDTSVILNLFNARRGGTDEVSKFNLDLLTFLTKNPTAKRSNRRFLISSLSIAEILYKPDGDETTVKKIVTSLDSEDVIFVSFDEQIAEHIKRKYHPLLPVKELNKFAKEISFEENNLVNAREWIIKDLMIIGTGDHSEVDVVLTTDYRTMYPLSKKMDVFCALTYPKFFDFKGENFYTYERRKADQEFGFDQE